MMTAKARGKGRIVVFQEGAPRAARGQLGANAAPSSARSRT